MKTKVFLLVMAAFFVLAGLSASMAQAQKELPTVTITTFTSPSLGFSTSALIKAKKFDIQNGININFVHKESRTVNADFAAGKDMLFAGSSLMTEPNRRVKGLKSVFLFSYVDYFGGVITENPDIKTLKDLEGKTLAANTVTTNYAIFRYLAQKAGVDLSKVNILSATTSALITYIVAKRVDAIQIWEPGFSQVLFENPGRFRPIFYHEGLKRDGKFAHGYVGVGTHESWLKDNKELVPKIYLAYKAAADWIPKNKDEAAKIISDAAGIPLGAVKNSVDTNQLAIYAATNEDIKDDIWFIFKAAVESGYTERLPDEGILYMGLKEQLKKMGKD